MDSQIKKISDLIASKSSLEANYHPVDRYFLEPYLDDILRFDSREFIFYVFESYSALYSEHLLLCLPELWSNISVEDLIYLSKSFSKLYSQFSIIMFTYRQIEINIIEILLNENPNREFKAEIVSYIQNQYNVLLRNGFEVLMVDELMGVDRDKWIYIKQRFLLDNRVLPALKTNEEINQYAMNLSKMS